VVGFTSRRGASYAQRPRVSVWCSATPVRASEVLRAMQTATEAPTHGNGADGDAIGGVDAYDLDPPVAPVPPGLTVFDANTTAMVDHMLRCDAQPGEWTASHIAWLHSEVVRHMWREFEITRREAALSQREMEFERHATASGHAPEVASRRNRPRRNRGRGPGPASVPAPGE
jgi:hypothetical protein